MRTLSVGLAAMAFSAFVHADFDGPAPLAWRWIQPTSSSPLGKPVVQEGVVYVAVGQRMYALDKETGNQKWKFPLVDPIEGNFKSTVLLVDGLAIAAADNKTLYAVDAKTGESKWTYIAPAPIYREPTITGKQITFGMTDNTITSIKIADGQPAWNAPIKVYDGFLGRVASYRDDFLYFTNAYDMVSLKTTTLKANWTKRFTALSPDVEPVVAGDTVYVNSSTYVIGLNAPGGRKVFEANSNDRLAFAPASNGEAIAAVTADGKVYLFKNNGLPVVRKEIDLGSQAAASPAPAGNFFAIPTRNGAINLVNARTGDIVWSYLIRPIGDVSSSSSSQSGPGGGRGQGPGGAGGIGGGQSNTPTTKVLAVPAAGPAVVDGNTLMILGLDGSLLAFDKQLGVDLTPPSVEQLWPSAGDVISGQPPLEFIFRIEDEASGIDNKTLKIDIDGQEMDYEFGRDGIAVVRISSLSKKNKPLSNGRKTVTVTVADWLGNVNKATFQVVIDNSLRPLVRPTGNDNNNNGGRGGPGGGRGGFGGGGDGR
ncbi:MAG: PQQ-binding-like beta-propeller repeat protein [Armatimonadetes bacterium]|nr:PQQ-binding-like beta-propeller repeat protein [Armatimonadota bacterium]